MYEGFSRKLPSGTNNVKAFPVSLTSVMSSHKAILTITQSNLKTIDQYRKQKSLQEYGGVIIV